PVLPVLDRPVRKDEGFRSAVPEPYKLSETNGALAQPGRDTLIQAMERTGWVQAKAARILGLTPRQIGYALKKHGIEMKRF
ncbi:MAG: nif-specific transcriptional activator NifA, partial [Rhodomicrobium sp.]|nr:nif-specific transcriptional activator NifA [Rhodomicrobium sp.]